MEKLTQKSYGTHLKHLKELKKYVGKEIGLTEWMVIPQEKIDSFADATDDHQWIHIDELRAAKDSPYKKTIAHGFLVLSLTSKVTFEVYSFADVTMGINYGLDRVRFPNATKSGALLRGRVTLMEFNEISGGAKYKVKVVFELKGEEKPACIAEFLAIAYADPNKLNIKKKVEKKSLLKKTKQTILYSKEGKVGIIKLNRPDKYNAVTPIMVEELKQVISIIRNDSSIRSVVLTGEGKGFCSGADMDTFGVATPEDSREYITNAYQSLLRSFTTLKKPIIAAVNGTAAGVGAAFALACDLRVMSDKSGILFAFINIGLGPDGGASWLLSRQVGYSKALEISLEGKKVNAEECFNLGLTNKIVKDNELFNKAMEWAKILAKKPTIAVGITKEDLLYSLDHSLQDTIAYESEKQLAAFASHDLIEGVSAFVEKRPPKFIGK
tara:strand:+ start:1439 stop:2755 length:1317 start_codon:yes stop_codon:yes gene_type:complete